MTTVNFGVSSNHDAARDESGDPARPEPRAGGDVMMAVAGCPPAQQGHAMDDATPDTAAVLLEAVTQAIAEAAAGRGVESLHRAQARAALAAIEAAGFAILPRPARKVRRSLGSALPGPRVGPAHPGRKATTKSSPRGTCSTVWLLCSIGCMRDDVASRGRLFRGDHAKLQADHGSGGVRPAQEAR